jgi:SagB-type dehydrogenase family enzyme
MNVIGKNLKTINAHLDMELVQDVLLFHNKGNLLIDKKFKKNLIAHTLSLDELFALERSDFEISPFYDDAIICDLIDQMGKRNRSAKAFMNTKIPFKTIKQLLSQSFGMRDDKSRPYPSGGALYPVEIICAIFSEKIDEDIESGFYHYRPTLNMLQPIKKMSSDKLRQILYAMESEKTAKPNFSFIYVGVVGKFLVKYQYRGYRYALMEAGAMFHEADLNSKRLGLINKLYSAFNDHELLKWMGLDRLGFIPLVAQSFGVAHEND